MPKLKFSIKESFDFAGKKFIDSFLFYCGASFLVIFIPGLASLFVAAFGVFLSEISQALGSFMIYIAPMVHLFFSGFFLVGLLEMVLNDKKGKNLGYQQLWSKKGSVVNFVVATFVYGLLVSLGLILFLIPGIYFGVRLSFYDLALVDNQSGPITAFRESMNITSGKFWSLFLFCFLLMSVSFFITTALLPLGFLASLPLIYLARVDAYDQLKNR